MNEFWVFFTMIGQPEFWAILGFALIFSYFIVRKKTDGEFKEIFKRALMFFGVAIFLSLALTQTIKYATMVKRPCQICGPYEVTCNVYCLSSPSFPSGHATATFAGFTSLFLIMGKRKKILPLFIIPVFTSLSRIFLGVHFWQDIIVGSLIGIIVPVIVYEIKKEWWDF